MESGKKKIGMWSLVMVVFVAAYGFSNVTSNLVYIGLAAIPSWIIVAILYFIPLTIMIVELAAANKDKSAGIYSWIECSLGTRWAFVGTWSYYITSIFFLQNVFGKLPVVVSWAIFGEDRFNDKTAYLIPWLAIGLIVALTFIAIMGVEKFSKISDLGGQLTLIATVLFILFAIIGYIGKITPSASEFTAANLTPAFDVNYFSTFSWLLLAVCGSEIAGTYIGQVDNPKKTYTKSVMVAAGLLIGSYILGSIAVCLIMSPAEISKYNIADSQFIVFKVLGDSFGISGKVVVQVYAFINVISSVACYVVWMESPIRAMFSDVPEGIFPKALSKSRSDGTMVNALWMQCGVLFVLFTISIVGLKSLSNFFVLLMNLTSLSTIVPYAIMVVAYFTYRSKNEHIDFAIIKSNFLAKMMSVIVLILSVAGFFGAGLGDVLGASASEAFKKVLMDYGGPILLLLIGWIIILLHDRKNKHKMQMSTDDNRKIG
ncbi:amino acid permease [Aminipila terrae]|uniref:Amino acid permease n=1 Tax=Aminipila terrae TaxID=2697030 RepID=A0A6P1ML21_9FIRM|nr:amino acid permease [Aminipila terrae]QHI72346.1 amino acid permease [Aminipila terrae]